MDTESFEIGGYRPPSEAYSLLIRATRYCPWNKCKFCIMSKGNKFELRPVEDIKQDIRTVKLIQDRINQVAWNSGYGDRVREVAAMVVNDPPNEAYRNVALWIYAGGENAFLQDSDSLIMRTPDLVEVLRFLKETLPGIKRVTSYGRSKTAAKKTLEDLKQIQQAGLSRLHIGLESGYDPVLQFIEKGVTAAEHIAGGRKIVESGISLSEYVILGMGGKRWWREHAIETARVLNEIGPDFIRVRTLGVVDGSRLKDEVEKGNFIRLTDEGIIEEEKLLIEHLECHTNYVSDHTTNLLQELEGKLPQDKGKMLAAINRFQALSDADRMNFIVGRRALVYSELDDLYNQQKRQTVEQIIHRLSKGSDEVDQETIYALMEGFL